MWKITGELSGGMPDPSDPNVWKECIEVKYAHTRIGLKVKTMHMKLFYDHVTVQKIKNKPSGI